MNGILMLLGTCSSQLSNSIFGKSFLGVVEILNTNKLCCPIVEIGSENKKQYGRGGILDSVLF